MVDPGPFQQITALDFPQGETFADLLFTGSFSSFDGTTVDSICTYDFATGTIDTTIGDLNGSFVGDARRTLFHADTGGLYFIFNWLYGYSSSGFGNFIDNEDWFEGCLWGDKIVVIGDDPTGNQIGVYDINADSFSTSEITDPVATGIYDDVHLTHVKTITIGGDEMLAFFGYQQRNFNSEKIAYCEIWDGSSYVYTLEDDYPNSGAMATTSTWYGDMLVNGSNVWFTHRLTRFSTSAGTNDHDYIVYWNPAGGVSDGWSRDADPFLFGLVNPNNPAPPGLFINEYAGSLYYSGADTWEDDGGSNVFSQRTVKLNQGFSPGTGTTFTDTGGFEDNVDFMEVVQGNAAGDLFLFASTDPAEDVESTAGVALDGGATKRLIYFNGTSWAEFGATPDNGYVRSILALNVADIVDL